MKKLHYFKVLILLFISICLSFCKHEDNPSSSGISNQTWEDGKSIEIIASKELSVNFNANNEWTASSDAEWCYVINESGFSGNNTLRLLVPTIASEQRSANISINVKGHGAAVLKVVQNKGTGVASEDMEVNIKVDKYLREMYLWNDEYKSIKVNYSNNYEDFFYGALGSLKTNTLDKRYYSPDKYSLYSYIEKKNNVASSKSAVLVDKELEYCYGITGLYAIYFYNESAFNYVVQGIYPDSPADKAGIKRGTVIKQVNGAKITNDNVNSFYFDLLRPSSISTVNITDNNGDQIQFTSISTYLNPIIFKQVQELYGKKIGYLVYNKFDASFDEELFEVFKYFKSQNITDLILDFRYNLGGYTMSANLISSCIAGSSASNKVFSSLRFNDTRMLELNNKRKEELFMYNKYSNLGISLSAGDLGLNHIYCLVGANTASSSELVINALRGIDIDVTLIGEQTTGKNVGMELIRLKAGNSNYDVAPITFQSYNAKGFGDYQDGFTPDVEIDETNPFNEEGVFYLPRAYGSNNEVLYAHAVKMITGVDISTNTKSSQNFIYAQHKRMITPVRVGFDGMLALPQIDIK